MTLDQLRIFVAVAERQHVTRAAEALNLVQSAVSAAMPFGTPSMIAASPTCHSARASRSAGRTRIAS